jgi:CRP-like cAMP-binding protein
MPATHCVCHHSIHAHKTGKIRGCTFCSCAAFKDPAELPPPPPAPLSEKAERAMEILARNPAFRHVLPEHLKEISRHGQRRLFLSEQLLMIQDEPSDSVHIMVKGQVKVERHVDDGRTLLLAELGPGDMVGEMGVLNGQPRSATVTALDDIETLELSAAALKQQFRDEPDVLLAVMRVVNERLKSTDELVDTSLQVALAQLGD